MCLYFVHLDDAYVSPPRCFCTSMQKFALLSAEHVFICELQMNTCSPDSWMLHARVNMLSSSCEKLVDHMLLVLEYCYLS